MIRVRSKGELVKRVKLPFFGNKGEERGEVEEVRGDGQ